MFKLITVCIFFVIVAELWNAEAAKSDDGDEDEAGSSSVPPDLLTDDMDEKTKGIVQNLYAIQDEDIKTEMLRLFVKAQKAYENKTITLKEYRESEDELIARMGKILEKQKPEKPKDNE